MSQLINEMERMHNESDIVAAINRAFNQKQITAGQVQELAEHFGLHIDIL